VTVRLHNYTEVRAYIEKEHAEWLRGLTPRHINAPADYWPQKVLAVSPANAAMQNYVSVHEHPDLIRRWLRSRARRRSSCAMRAYLLCLAGTPGRRAVDPSRQSPSYIVSPSRRQHNVTITGNEDGCHCYL